MAGMLAWVLVRVVGGLLLLCSLLIGLAMWSADWSDWSLLQAAPSFVEKVPQLHGMSDQSIFARLGQPDHDTQFTMDQAVGEFRIELHNTYPASVPEYASVVIRECTWRYEGHSLTVWFHKVTNRWQSLDTCRYSDDVRF